MMCEISEPTVRVGTFSYHIGHSDILPSYQVILTSTSWMPAPEGCTTASPLPAADSARSVQDPGAGIHEVDVKIT